MAVPIGLIVPLVGQVLSLSLRIAEIIEKSKEVNAKDKETLRALINEAKDSVTYIDEDNKEGN